VTKRSIIYEVSDSAPDVFFHRTIWEVFIGDSLEKGWHFQKSLASVWMNHLSIAILVSQQQLVHDIVTPKVRPRSCQ